MMLLPMSFVAHRASLSAAREATTASGVDNAASPDCYDTAERDYFTPREADHYAKTTGKEPRSILMSSADVELPISMATHAIIVSNTHALPAEYKCLK